MTLLRSLPRRQTRTAAAHLPHSRRLYTNRWRLRLCDDSRHFLKTRENSRTCRTTSVARECVRALEGKKGSRPERKRASFLMMFPLPGRYQFSSFQGGGGGLGVDGPDVRKQ